jgi:hypothetical protein
MNGPWLWQRPLLFTRWLTARVKQGGGIFVVCEESTSKSSSTPPRSDGSSGAGQKDALFLNARFAPDVVKAGECDLIGMLTVLQAQAQEIHARMVFDGIDVMLGLLDDPAPSVERCTASATGSRTPG